MPPLSPDNFISLMIKGGISFPWNWIRCKIKRLLQGKKRDAESYANRGDLLRAERRYDQAIANYTKALEINPQYHTVYYQRGLAYKEKGFFWLAILDFTRILLMNPAHAEARHQRGTIFLELGLYDQALTDYTQALDLNPLSSEQSTAYLNCGLAYFNQGDYLQALCEFNRAIRAAPRDGKLYCHRAEAYYRLRRYPAAWADIHQAHGLGQPIDPEFLRLLQEKSNKQPAPRDYADFYLVRGNENLQQGLDDLAMDSYNQAIKINPELAAAYNNRGLVNMRQERYNLAGEDFNRALAIDPHLAETCWNRALTYYYRAQYEEAWEDAHQALALGYPARSDLVQILQKILAREPAIAMGADYYQQRGTSYLKQGWFDQAISEFSEALNLNPESADTYFSRGIALKNKGLPEPAIQDFTQALRQDPDRVEAYYQRAVCCFLLHQYDMAWADVHQVHHRGHKFSAKFLQVLREASGRQE